MEVDVRGSERVPALIQVPLMFTLPESPRWEEEAQEILKKIYPPEEVEGEIRALKESIDMEIKETESSEKVGMIKLLRTKAVRRGLYVGTGLLIFQRVVGINTVMYYDPTIVRLAGFASNEQHFFVTHHIRPKCIWFNSEHILH
ncbi:hypothetical protein ACSQ67_006188 [Phaseolus vulgaris]